MIDKAGPERGQLDSCIEGEWTNLSATERRVASYLKENEKSIPFETGASLARRVGVSEMTVSRTLNRLGFKGLAAVKDELMSSDGLSALDTESRGRRLLTGSFGKFLKQEAEAILSISSLVERPEWSDTVDRLHRADDIIVVSFQMVRGHAEDFARRLSGIRPNVRYAAAHDGCLTELTDTRGREALRALVLVDVSPYARDAETVAGIAVSAGLELVILTDTLNPWARQLTDRVLAVPSSSELMIESTGPLATLMAVLLHAVAERGPEATARHQAAWANTAGALRFFSTNPAAWKARRAPK